MLRRSSALALLRLALPAFLAGSAPSPTAAATALAVRPRVARRECERLNDSGTYADALPHCRAAAARLRGAGAQDGAQDGSDLGRALTSLGLALEMTGDRSAAEASYREALAPATAASADRRRRPSSCRTSRRWRSAAATTAQPSPGSPRRRRSPAAPSPPATTSWAPAELEYVRMNRSVALEQLGAYAEALAQIRPLASRALAEGARGDRDQRVGGAGGQPGGALPQPRRSAARARPARSCPCRLRSAGRPFRARQRASQPGARLSAQPARAGGRGDRPHPRPRARRESGDRSEETRTLCALGDLRLSGGHLVEARSAFELALASATAVRRRGRPLGGSRRIGARRPRGGRPERGARPPACRDRRRSKRPAKVSAIRPCAVACSRISARSTPPPSICWRSVH